MATVIPIDDGSAPQQPQKGPQPPASSSYFQGTSEGTYHAYTQVNPMGVAEGVFTNEVSPEDAISSDLAPGETVVQVYEVFYPAGFSSAWKRCLCCVLTLGISECLFYCNMWCIRHGWKAPGALQFTKGKMAVTSNGRLIVWTTNVMQKKLPPAMGWCVICCGYLSFQPSAAFLFCAPPCFSFIVWLVLYGIPGCIAKTVCPKLCAPKVEFETVTSVRCYSAAQIRDIELSSKKVMPFLCGICCCAERYEASLRVEFGTFGDYDGYGAAVRAMPTTEYSNKVKATMTKNFAAKWFRPMLSSEGGVGMNEQLQDHSLDYVIIMSAKENDNEYDREHPTCKAAFDGLSAVYRDLVAVAMTSRTPVWTKLPEGTPGIKMPRSDALADEFDLSIVSDHDCNAPHELLPLAPDEEILACSSNMPTRTCVHSLKFAFYVLCMVLSPFFVFFWLVPFHYGWSGIDALRKKFMRRPGVVVTTHRLTKIEVVREDSILSLCIPSCVLCCCPTAKGLNVRSFFPNTVMNGLITRIDKQEVGCALLTDAGALEVVFDVTLEGLPDLVSDAACGSKINKRFAFLKQLCHTVYKPPKAIDAAAVRLSDEECGSGTLGTAKLTPLEFSRLERSTLPLHDGEQLISRFEGKIYEDTCTGCTNRQTWYPGCCLLLSCGVMPKSASQSVMLTDAGVYFMSINGNDPWCLLSMCYRKKDFDIFWAPISKLAASEVATEVQGRETFCRRLCEGNIVGMNCCPKMKSMLTLSVAVADFGDCFSLNCSAISAYESLRKQPDVVRFRKTCAMVQGTINDKTIAAPKPTGTPIMAQPAMNQPAMMQGAAVL